MENQNQLFNDSYTPEILDNIDHAMHSTDSKAWPSIVVDLYKIVKIQLEQQGIDDIQATLDTTLALVDYLGGMQVYVPKGERLRKYIRDMEIYYRFNGRNIRQLAKQYNKPEQSIYRIIAEQKALHIKRKQHSLL